MESKLQSPFRYPGGKRRLLNRILPHLETHAHSASTYVEPFVGGGSTLLAIAERHPEMQLVVNDGDPGVAAFWMCMRSYAASQALGARVRQTVPTVGLFQASKTQLVKNRNPFEKAFAFLVLNRCAYSGNVSSGPMGGYGQTGKSDVASRWNAQRIADRIARLHEAVGDRLEIHCEDSIHFIKRFYDREDVLMYADPPYVLAGNQQYRLKNSFWFHYMLAKTLRRAKYPWVCSYDMCSQVEGLYREAPAMLPLNAWYSGGKTRKREALILGGMGWNRRGQGRPGKQPAVAAPLRVPQSAN